MLLLLQYTIIYQFPTLVQQVILELYKQRGVYRVSQSQQKTNVPF